MKKVSFKGWKNCVEMKSGDFKIVVTTEVGPRIIGGFIGGSENIFCVVPETAGRTGGKEWNLFGGHRIWHSPEAKPRTYAPDNEKIKVCEAGGGLRFCSGTEATTGVHKSMTIIPLGKERFRIEHRLRNENLWEIELAAWALSVMDAGGVAVVPQPQGDKKALLPNRYLTVWPYTNMADSRCVWGDKFILLRQDRKAKGPCKFGLNCEDGWLAYVNKGVALVKSFEHLIDAEYPDNGCSIECYTNDFMLEVETLSPLFQLAPGEEMLHVEEWTGVKGVKDIKDAADAAKYFPLKKGRK